MKVLKNCLFDWFYESLYLKKKISPSDSKRESVTCDSESVNINSLHVLGIKYELLELVAGPDWKYSINSDRFLPN